MKAMRICCFSALLMSASAGLSSCSDDDPWMDDPVPEQPAPPTDETVGDDEETDSPEAVTDTLVVATVGGRSFTLTPADNASAKAFCALLPLTLSMEELNGNEKYHNLSDNLPTAAYRPGTIHAGDLMLFGTRCVVLFYETFTTSYSYTPLGRIEAPAGLAEALGTGDATVTFELKTVQRQQK